VPVIAGSKQKNPAVGWVFYVFFVSFSKDMRQPSRQGATLDVVVAGLNGA
jgi:hypothetical protein